MEEKKNEQKVQGKVDKKLYWKVLGIFIVGLAIIVLIIFVNKKNVEQVIQEEVAQEQAMQQANELTEEKTTSENGETEQVAQPLIDMSNTENAKVEEGKKENTSDELLKEKTFGDYAVKDIKLYAQNGATYFKATVTNNSKEKYDAKPILITFLNKDGSDNATLNAYIGDMPAGGTANINASTTQDLANAYNFKIQF